jgi:1-acyl-sn-glycerol-3-phosphate acyltransferase
VRAPPPIRWIAPPRAFERAWRATYEVVYFALECVAYLIFRPMFRVRHAGPPPSLPRGGVLLCPNHQSYLDPAFVQLSVNRHLTFVMTNDFYSSALANWFFRLVGAIPVAPGRMSIASMRRAAAMLRLGFAVVVFPEGRLSTDGSLSSAQRGISVIARRGRAPVVPVAIDGAIKAWPRGRRWMRPADVRVAVGHAMPFEAATGKDAEQGFADRVLAEISRLKDGLPPSLDE